MVTIEPSDGADREAAQRWLDLGIVRFQPSEIMKIGVVLALARWYHGASAQEARLSWKLAWPVAIIGAPFLLVAHQPDLGSGLEGHGLVERALGGVPDEGPRKGCRQHDETRCNLARIH